MEHLYIVLWRTFRGQWAVDGLYSDAAIAKAKLHLMSLEEPKWEHAMAEFDVPTAETEAQP